MRENRLRKRKSENKPAICSWVSCDNSFITELAAHGPVDGVVIDTQHGMADAHSMPAQLQAISTTDKTPIVRVRSLDSGLVMKALDAGAQAIICPLINTADEARELVFAGRYPPQGGRSFGPARGVLYGGPDYFKTANDTIMILAMIETQEGLTNLDEILAVEGLDGIFIGPSDMAVTMGHAPGPEGAYDDVEAAIERCVTAAKAAGKYTGIFCSGGKGARLRADQGFDMVVPNHDGNLYSMMLKQQVEIFNGKA